MRRSIRTRHASYDAKSPSSDEHGQQGELSAIPPIIRVATLKLTPSILQLIRYRDVFDELRNIFFKLSDIEISLLTNETDCHCRYRRRYVNRPCSLRC